MLVRIRLSRTFKPLQTPERVFAFGFFDSSGREIFVQNRLGVNFVVHNDIIKIKY